MPCLDLLAWLDAVHDHCQNQGRSTSMRQAPRSKLWQVFEIYSPSRDPHLPMMRRSISAESTASEISENYQRCFYGHCKSLLCYRLWTRIPPRDYLPELHWSLAWHLHVKEKREVAGCRPSGLPARGSSRRSSAIQAKHRPKSVRLSPIRINPYRSSFFVLNQGVPNRDIECRLRPARFRLGQITPSG